MAKGTKAGQFSPVSLEALELIAKEKKDPRLLIAYLGLARHTTMNDLDGRGPNMLTGAGAEKVRVLTGCGTPMAGGIVRALEKMGLIKKAPSGLPSTQARWAMQHRGSVNIPHALIDGLGDAEGIGRLLKAGATSEVVVCAIMLLVHCYAEHNLESFGGINHKWLWRKWEHSISAEGEGFKVAAEPVTDTVSNGYLRKIIASVGGQLNADNNSNVFWSAFDLLKSSGLLYEVVTAFDPEGTRLPIRVNDFHATWNEASLLSDAAGVGVGFYVNKDNDRLEPESCWFYLPSEPKEVVGIWRLRFRCATPETALGLELDQASVTKAIEEMGAKSILYVG